MSNLRRCYDGFLHWCPGCREVHRLPSRWTFNGNVETPSFSPSFLHTTSFSSRPPKVCHYILTAGVLNFCGDCTHDMAGQAVPLPPWPYLPGEYGGVIEDAAAPAEGGAP